MTKHCWHATGYSSSTGHGGADQVQCCWCGKPGARKWHTEYGSLPGHGPNYATDIRVDEPMPDETCPKRFNDVGPAPDVA